MDNRTWLTVCDSLYLRTWRKHQKQKLLSLWSRSKRRQRPCPRPQRPLVMARLECLGLQASSSASLESALGMLCRPQVSLPSINIYNVEYAELPAECHGGLSAPAPLPASIPMDKIMSNIEPCLILPATVSMLKFWSFKAGHISGWTENPVGS